MTEADAVTLPPAMREIADDFAELTAPERLQLLLEFSEGLPELPERYAGSLDSMEQVHECQSPIFLAVEVGDEPTSTPGERPVHLFFSAPPEAPTTRGFAGIRAGAAVTPPYQFSLGEAVSPLRLRGMVGMLSRIKRQVALKSQS